MSTTAEVLNDALTSEKIDAGRIVNLVEAVNEIADALKDVGQAITPICAGSHDEAGGFVTSLTESVMGVTKSLVMAAGNLRMIAESIDGLADAVREHK